MKTHHSRFYLILSVILLLVVLLGFGPRFYLRAFFDQPEHLQMDRLPVLFIMHGTLMTLWYVLLVTQSVLINSNKVTLHMNIGRALVILAILVVLFAFPVMMGFAPRMVDAGFLDIYDTERMEFQCAMWTIDLLGLILFAGMVSIGILKRKDKIIHRCMMLFASMVFMGPAIFRLFEWMAPDFIMQGVAVLFFLFPIAFLVHDWLYLKKFPLHALFGLLTLILLYVLTFTLPTFDFWMELFKNHLS